jgi:hypothetical protein
MRCLREPYEGKALGAGCIRRNFDCVVGWYVDSRGVLGGDPVLWPTAATELV